MNRYLLVALLVSLVAVAAMPFSQAQDGGKAPVLGNGKELVQGNTEFAFDLYGRLRQQKGNVVFSPYSISNALAMTYAGARGQTAAQMAKVLHFTLPQERLHPAFAELIGELHREEKGRPYQLRVANSLWGQKGYPFVPAFLQLTQENYRAGLKEVDFVRFSEDARKTINRWVEEQTQDKIKELLLPGDLKVDTRLVLTNALYLKATWASPFPKKLTKPAPFAVTAEQKVQVEMMTNPNAVLPYFAGDDFHCLVLPYKGDRLGMVVFLPRKQGRLADLEKALTAAALREALGKLQLHRGEVSLPRFKTTFRCLLADDLKELGMPLAFSPAADFSGIAPNRELFITKIVHKTFIAVDEVGTEGAAATAVVMGKKAFPAFAFRADHPFLFLVHDWPTGTILFLGRVTDPRG